MPKMNGSDLAKAYAAQQPGVKVLFMSGYTDAGIVHHKVMDANIAFISKPSRLMR